MLENRDVCNGSLKSPHSLNHWQLPVICHLGIVLKQIETVSKSAYDSQEKY
jgi:hypothetical protein